MQAEFLLLVDKNGPIPPLDPTWGPLGACWIWKGRSTRRFGDQRPHRASYKMFVGPISTDPDKKHVCHKCHNSLAGGDFLCVNPTHLFLGKPTDGHCLDYTRSISQFNERAATDFMKLVDQNGPVVSKPNWGVLSPCWIWQGKSSWHRLIPYRAAYELFVGKIQPSQPFICHKCDHGQHHEFVCVNPDHLFAGTQKDNIADCVAKDRLNHYRLAV